MQYIIGRLAGILNINRMKEIKLTNGQVALVDDEDYAWLNQWRWCPQRDKHRNVYARRNIYIVIKNGQR